MGRQAWKVLEENGPAVHALLLRLTLRRDVADELLQDLFVRLSGQMNGALDPAAYIKRCAVNLAMDWRRRDGVRKKLSHADLPPPRPAPDPGELATATEDVERILAAAANLSELEREAFVLRYIEQESYERIAAAINKTPHQARGICHAAVKQVRRMLTEGRADQ